MKAITFLGTNRNYKETTYALNGKSFQTMLFPIALCHLLEPKPSELLVVVTEAAKEIWFDVLASQVATLGINVIDVDIPDGHSVQDLWRIFSLLTDHLSEGDEVVFDITYSFRTLPFLSFLAASYLRVAKRVTLSGVYYGAWEARSPLPPANEPFSSAPTDISPVFDLTPFVALLELTTATDQFLKTGNAGALASLVQQEHLRVLIEQIANGLHVLRPVEVLEQAQQLVVLKPTLSSSLANTPPPFDTLIRRIQDDYGTFGLSNPVDPANRTQLLARLLDVVDWYWQKGQVIHAVALAREWIPTRMCCHFNLDPFNTSDRDMMDTLIKGNLNARQSPYWTKWLAFPLRKEVRRVWGPLSQLRNDVLHCGFRPEYKDADAIAKETKILLDRLNDLGRKWV